jgi:hypothetical protein
VVTVNLWNTDWRRSVAGEPFIPLRNRYLEANPTNLKEGTAILSRPSNQRFVSVGEGPIRALFSEPGSFGGALFIVSGQELYRLDPTNIVTFIGSGIAGNPDGFPSIAITSALGPGTPEFCYVADGTTLWLYTENGYALGVLSAAGAIQNNDVIEIGGVYYQWTNASVNAGTPAGTSANPWLVQLGGSNVVSLDNMRAAINNDGDAGTQYSTLLVEHPTVLGRSSTALTLRVQARDVGAPGNGITTTETGANISWGAATLTGGGSPYLTTVDMPDDLAPVSVAFVAGYVIVVPKTTNVSGFNGRFFWIEPGETFIRPLNFATAERSPDPLFAVRVVGDQFWLLGEKTTEVWYPTGDFEVPFLRVQGQVFDRGTVEGTDAQIKDTIIVADSDGVVYAISGGAPQRISDNSVEERIRTALRLAKVL